MQRKELTEDMSRFVRDEMNHKKEVVFGMPKFIRRTELAKFMGEKDPHSIDSILAGLARTETKKYYIPDVVTNILIRSEWK